MSDYEREARRERLEALRRKGLDPFPARVGPHTRLTEVRATYADRDADALEADAVEVAVCGRAMAHRSFGKLVFVDLRQDGETLQVSGRKQTLDPETFESLKQVDVGDFVRVEGVLWRTRSGELTVDARRVEIVAKALRPLPEKWHGLTDVETRYRQRYLDLLVNDEARRIAVVRSHALRALRDYLDGRGFLEVETPVLQPLYGGAAARPFDTYYKALEQQLYLRISDELYLKRLVAGGLERVYEVAHNFRNEGVSHKHSPEFTMMECYQAYADYRDMMVVAHGLVQHMAVEAAGSLQVQFRENEIDLSGEWPQISMRDAILEATEGEVDVLEESDWRPHQRRLVERGVEIREQPTWATFVDEVFSVLVEPELIQPTFVVNHPSELSPLAKRVPGDPRIVERFELFIGGMEIANAFSELNDPDDQRARFEEQRRAAAEGDEEAHPLDEDYLRVLEHGLPPTGGLGVGVDRLVMVLSGVTHIREVILFPTLRPESGGEGT